MYQCCTDALIRGTDPRILIRIRTKMSLPQHWKKAGFRIRIDLMRIRIRIRIQHFV
jgi:hypothetical protein